MKTENKVTVEAFVEDPAVSEAIEVITAVHEQVSYEGATDEQLAQLIYQAELIIKKAEKERSERSLNQEWFVELKKQSVILQKLYASFKKGVIRVNLTCVCLYEIKKINDQLLDANFMVGFGPIMTEGIAVNLNFLISSLKRYSLAKEKNRSHRDAIQIDFSKLLSDLTTFIAICERSELTQSS